jgi:hypothetical protein
LLNEFNVQNNLFNRFLLLLGFFKFKKTESKDEAFNRLKKLVLSVKNREDLINAVKLINHFNKTYEINPESAEFIYFNKIVNLMRLIIRKKHKKSGDKNDEGQWKCEIELERY